MAPQFLRTVFSRSLVSLTGLVSLLAAPALAQITPAPNTTGTTVETVNNQLNIGGGQLSGNGQNLFHLFRDFNVQQGQTANFLSTPQIQNILAGVNGGSASYINGVLKVTGGNSNLYLLNPAGIVFGPNAQLNLPAAFHASTAQRVHFGGGIFDLNGANSYTQLNGSPLGFEFANKGILINEGNLSVNAGQSLTLMAHQVMNTGTLGAAGGTVNVVAVPESGLVRVSQEGMLLSLEIPQERLPAAGMIQPIDLPTLLTGGNGYPAVNSVIQNPDGTIHLVHDSTKIPLTTNTAVIGGTIDVSHTTGSGGKITIAGQGSNIALINAQLTAAGNTGGGTILVGGDYLGGTTGTNRLDPTFNTSNLFVNDGTSLNADALSQGDGGTIINWSDNSTRFYGQISARGGALSGNGGFVEVSGKQYLDFQGTVDTTAPNGTTGTLLLDPTDITIADLPNQDITPSTPFQADPINAEQSFLNVNTLTTALATSNVIVSTESGGNAAGNIFVGAPINSNSTNSLTLQANQDIILQEPIAIQGSLILNADRAIVNNFSLANPININAAQITINANLVTIGADINLNATGNIFLLNGTITTIFEISETIGNINITSTNGTIFLRGDVTAGVGNVAFNGNTGLTGPTNVSGANIIFNGNITGLAALSLNAITTTILNGDTTVGTLTTSGSGSTQIRGSIDTSGNQTFNNPVIIDDPTPNTPLQIDGNELTFNSTVNIGGGTVLFTGDIFNFNGGKGSVSGSGTIIFGKTSGLFSQSDLDPLAKGFQQIILGSASDVFLTSHLITSDPLIIGTVQSINTNSFSITGQDGASITLMSTTPTTLQGFFTGAVNLTNLPELPIGFGTVTTGDITTFGNDINIIGQVVTTGNLSSGANVLVRANGNIQLNNVTATSGINLSSPAEITTNHLQITQSGGIIRVVANNDITLGDVISSGGAIAIFSSAQSISTGNINSHGGFVYLDSITGITTGNVTTGGGNFDAVAYRGQLTTGSINTAGSGGSVTLFAPNITTGNIFTNGGSFLAQTGNFDVETDVSTINSILDGSLTLRGLLANQAPPTGNLTLGNLATNGGNVNLRGGNLVFNFINAEVGGVDIYAENSLRALGTFDRNGVPTSIFGRSVNIFINNDTSFLVGDSDLNGTAGAIQSENSIISPQRTLSGLVEVGNIRFENTGQSEPIIPEQEANTLLEPPPPVTYAPSQLPPESPPILLTTDIEIALVNNDLERALTLLDQRGCQEVTGYFGRTCNVREISVKETQAALNEIAKQTGKKPAVIYTLARPDQLDLMMVTPEGEPIHLPVRGVGREQLLKTVDQFTNSVRDPRLVNTRAYLPASQQLYQWLIAPLRSQLDAQGVETLVFVLDSGMRGIPVAALHDGKGFLIERFSMALVPSMSLMDTRYRSVQQARILAMGASEFKDQSPLPAVPVELAQITKDLGGGTEFLNADFTIPNLERQHRQGTYQIIHLATHGEFQPGSPENSYIAFTDGRLNLLQLRNLRLYRPETELLTLSACRTAVGDLDAELGFAGLSVQSGVKSVLASLWYVSDEGTLALMTGFYNQLNRAPIKAEALRQAQLAMLRGDITVKGNELRTIRGGIPLPPEVAVGDRSLSHPYFWAAFTMIGSPW